MTSYYMEEYANYLKANKRKPRTINAYTRAVKECLAYINKSVNNIAYIDIVNWFGSISDKSSATIALYVEAVKSYAEFLRNVEVANIPVEKLKRPVVHSKAKPYMTVENVRTVANTARSARDKAIILFIAYTGLRVSELTALTIKEYGNAKVKRELVVDGKGDKERVIYINDDLMNTIDEYLNKRRANSEFLFCTNSGAKMNEQNITHTIKNCAERAGLPFNVTAHTLRAAFATILGDSGVPVAVISKALGHSSLAVTTRYIRTQQNAINAAMAGIKI